MRSRGSGREARQVEGATVAKQERKRENISEMKIGGSRFSRESTKR